MMIDDLAVLLWGELGCQSLLGFKWLRLESTQKPQTFSSQNFWKLYPRTNIVRQMFSFQAIDLWQDIPYYFKDLNTLSLDKEVKCWNDVLFRLVTSVGQRKKNSESPWGIEPQTFGFRAPMLRWIRRSDSEDSIPCGVSEFFSLSHARDKTKKNIFSMSLPS